MLKKLFLLALGVLLLNAQTVSAKNINTNEFSKELIDTRGQRVTLNNVPGIKESERKTGRIVKTSELDKKGVKIINNIPAFDWSYGCTATSASMYAAYLDAYTSDGKGYENIYLGPTNDGVMPSDNNSSWGSEECPLSATHKGIDGLTEDGHVDRFWTGINNSGDDPFGGENDPTGTYKNCLADFMGTNQDWWNNVDGSTSYFSYPDGTALSNFSYYEDPSDPNDRKRDAAYGIRKFFESRGYDVTANYNQVIRELSSDDTKGFTFEDFKSEIDNNYPVLLHVTGHTMLAKGYKEADGSGDNKDSIYIHDTWNYDTHIMAWNGVYSGRQHKAMTVIHVEPKGEAMELVFDTTKENGTDVTLPLYGAVDVAVNWGDGNMDLFDYSYGGNGTDGEQTHTYTEEGVYTVTISGSLEHYGRPGYNADNALKLTAVNSFGDMGLVSLHSAFRGAGNLTSVPATLPATVTTLQEAFQDADSFNDPTIKNWDVSNVENMRTMFAFCDIFNQDIGNWNISQVTTMHSMFYNVTLSTENYDAILNGFAAQSVQADVSFSGGNSKYTNAALAARNTLTGEPNNWTISDGGMIAALPAVTTQAVTDITEFSAIGNGTVTAINGANITERGVYWSLTNGFADGEGTKVSESGSWTEGAFTSNITGLTAGNPYFVKAFATNSAGTSYGEQVSFTPVAMTPPGNALEFNNSGVNAGADLGDNIILNSNFTQEMWLNVNSNLPAGWRALLTPAAGARSPFIYCDKTNIHYGFSNGTTEFYTVAPNTHGTNSWFHLALTFDGTNYRTYINGKMVYNYAGAAGQTPCTTPIKYLALNYDNGSEIDELRMWNVARTAEQIRNNMKQTLVGNETGLVAYYKFDAASGSTLQDMSSNNNNGTLLNAGVTSWIASDAMQLPQTALAGSNETDKSFTANWEVNYTATKYFLDVSTVNDFSSFVAGYENKEITDENATSQVVSGLTGETTYYYRVRSFNEFTGKTSANSAVITVTTIADTQAPVVTVDAGQVVETSGTNSAIVQSNELGTVYIVLETVDPQTTVEDFEAALAIGLAAKASITEINTDTEVFVAGISNGFYYAYAVDEAGNISAKGTNAIQVIYPNGIDSVIPEVTELVGNYPNPFNPETTIKFNIASDSNVNISIFNYKGELVQELVNKFQPAGKYSIKWNGSNATSGIYFYKMTAGKYTRIKRAVMVK